MKSRVSVAQQDAEARGNLYRFLSNVYLRPLNRELLQPIVDKGFLCGLSALFGEGSVENLKTFAASPHRDKDLVSLKQEYMGLFAVPTGRYVAPFEDVYRGETVNGDQQRGPLLGERAVAVKRIYREAGAEMDRVCKELPTHIGVELSFMSFLCERQAAALCFEQGVGALSQDEEQVTDSVTYRELQTRFLQDHLTVWFPQLHKSIQANAKSSLYRGLAQVTEAFLVQDTNNLQTQNLRA
jgi:TorA maturation chaperone TorD